mmetsp:Transcript_10449/g.15645  ORF Transcript_10449/g.15645 Transcript_10449/m.15645 type:complete len:254 (-) Transcript_10449:83-844(-)
MKVKRERVLNSAVIPPLHLQQLKALCWRAIDVAIHWLASPDWPSLWSYDMHLCLVWMGVPISGHSIPSNLRSVWRSGSDVTPPIQVDLLEVPLGRHFGRARCPRIAVLASVLKKMCTPSRVLLGDFADQDLLFSPIKTPLPVRPGHSTCERRIQLNPFNFFLAASSDGYPILSDCPPPCIASFVACIFRGKLEQVSIHFRACRPIRRLSTLRWAGRYVWRPWNTASCRGTGCSATETHHTSMRLHPQGLCGGS